MFAFLPRLSFRGLLLVALGVIGGGVVAIAIAVAALRNDAIEDAVNDTNNLATVLAEQTARAVQAIDIAISEIAERLASRSELPDTDYDAFLRSQVTHDYLRERLSRLPQTEVIGLIDNDGLLVNGTRVWPAVSGDFTDRDYFLYARDHPGSQLFVSSVVQNRVSGQPNIFFAKRIEAPDGTFLGIVLAGVRPSYFQHIYQSLISSRQQAFALLRNDGLALVRYPDLDKVTGRRLPATSQWYGVVKDGGGHFQSIGGFDGIPRLMSVRPLKDLPLVVNVGVPKSAALASWRYRATAIGIGTALALICSLFLLYALYRQFAQLAASKVSVIEREARLAEKTAELEQANTRIDSAVNHMIQGLVMYDSAGNLVVCNDRFIEMYDLPPSETKPGISIRHVLELRTDAGNFFDDIDAYIDELRATMSAGQPLTKTADLGNGRTYSITNRPTTDGGWVATHEDITERQRDQKELQQTRNMLRAMVENIPEALVVKDAKTREYVFINRAGEKLFDVRKDDFIGKTSDDVFPEAIAKRVQARDDEALRIGHLALEAREAVTHDGLERDLKCNRIVIVAKDGTPEYILIVIEDVTAQRTGQRELESARNMLRAVVENIPETLVVKNAITRRYVFLNRAGEALLGVQRDQFIGKTGDEVFPDEADKVRARDEQSLRTGQLLIESRKVVAVDGRDRDVTSKRIAIPGKDGRPEYILNVIEDVTDRLRNEQELARAQDMLSAVVENIPEMLVVKDAKTGQYVFVNRAGVELLGTSKSMMIGKTTEEIFDKEQADVILARDREALRTRQMIEAVQVTRTQDGRLCDIVSKRIAIGGKDNEPEYLLTVIEDITERKRNETRIAHLAHHDPLTDLANRAALNMKLAETVEHAAAAGTKFALLCVDLDRFKEVNDLYGHAAGDNVLLEIARRMRSAADDTFLARLGGDEFMAICIDGTTTEAATELAQKLVAAVSGDIDSDGRKVRLGMSVGIAMYPADGTDVVTLLRNADAALYRAKAEGRSAIRFYEADMDRMLRDRRALQGDLALAVSRNELQIYYQPQARVTGQVIGFEALLRWDHLRRGFVPPDTFIPLAEETGLIEQIGEWVLREACREAASWRKPLQIAINLSPLQLRHQELVPLVHSILIETGLAPERLLLEITEGALMDDYSRAVSILRRLKALGVRIAMDDFGTGYSSLSYLQSFPFDKIKIDQTFIANLERNAQSAAIVRAVLGLGRSLDLITVAEGVETQAQLTILRSEGCDEMQGYLIGRPQPIVEYAELVGRPAPERRAVG